MCKYYVNSIIAKREELQVPHKLHLDTRSNAANGYSSLLQEARSPSCLS